MEENENIIDEVSPIEIFNKLNVNLTESDHENTTSLANSCKGSTDSAAEIGNKESVSEVS